MDNHKIGLTIKNLRNKNNLTQAQFAEKYNVTYQAVSKWENGKNIPDISILKQICDDFNININDMLSGKKNNKKKNLLIVIFFCLILILILTFFILKIYNIDDFKFKELSTSCKNFDISGSLAYNNKQSNLYISNIEYCDNTDKTKYLKIECTLYENHNDVKIIIDSKIIENDSLTLGQFLEDITFSLDDFSQSCSLYKEGMLYLEINATEKNKKTTNYKIPLNFNENCNQKD